MLNEDLLAAARRITDNASTTPRNVAANTARNTSGSSGARFSLNFGQAQEEEPENNQGFGTRALFGALDFLDTGRSAVVSGVKETVDFTQGEGFSFDDFVQQTRDNYGFGQLIEEETDIDNIWVKRGLGFAGDVLLDPLTYLAPGAGLARAGRTGVARAAFAQGDNVLGQKILQRGTSAASADDLTRLGFGDQAGTFINVPLSKTAKKITRTGDTSQPTQVRLSRRGTGGTRLGNEILGVGRQAWYRNADGLAAAMSGQNAGVRRQMIKGTADEAAQAFKTLDRINEANAATRFMGRDIGLRWAQMADDLQGQGVDGKTAYDALGGDTAAQQAVRDAGGDVDALLGFGEVVRENANSVAGQDFIQFRKDWQPTLLTEDMVGYLRGQNPPAGRGARNAVFEERATLIEGETFMGVELLAPDADAGIPAVREQVHRILADTAADGGNINFTSMFNDNLYEAMPAYLVGVTQRTRFRRIETGLLEDGIAVERFKQVYDEDASRAAQRRYAKGEKELRKLKASTSKAQARQQRAYERARAAQGLADDLGPDDVGAAREAFVSFDRAARLRNRSMATQRMADAARRAGVLAADSAAESAEALTNLRAANVELDELIGASTRDLGKARRAQRRLVRELNESRTETPTQELFDRQLELRDEIDRLSDEIADGEVALEGAGRRPREIKRDRRAAQTKADELIEAENEIVTALRRALDADADVGNTSSAAAVLERAGLPSDLRRAAKMRDQLKELREEAQRSVRLFNEELRETRAPRGGREELTDRLAQLEDEAAAGAAQLDDDALADIEEIREILATMPAINQRGYLQDLAGDDVWYHGTPTGLNPFEAPTQRQTGLIDTFAGVHVTTSRDLAETFSRRVSGSGLDEAYEETQGRVLKMNVKAENPRVYDIADDMDLSEPERWAEFGSGRAASLRAMSQDMMLGAIEDGIMDEQIPSLARRLADKINKSPDLYGEREAFDQGLELTTVDEIESFLTNVVQGIDDGGMSAADAIADALSPTLRRGTGTKAQGSILGTPADERAVNWFVNELADVLSVEDRNLAGQLFRDGLMDEGFDSIVYRYGDGSWAAIAIEPQSLVPVDADAVDPNWLVTTQEHIQRLKTREADGRNALAEAKSDIGMDIEAQTTTIAAATKARRDNLLKQRRIEERANGARKAVSARDREELALRQRAEQDWAAAEQLEIEAQQLDDVSAERQRARAQAARLAGQARKSAADFDAKVAKTRTKQLEQNEWVGALKRDDFQKTVQHAMLDNFSELSKGSMAPTDVTEAVNAMSRVVTPEGWAAW